MIISSIVCHLTFCVVKPCFKDPVKYAVLRVKHYIVKNPVLRRFILDSLVNLFNHTPSKSIWEAYSYVVVNAWRIFIQKYLPLSIARYSFKQLRELEQCRVIKLAQGLKWQHRI